MRRQREAIAAPVQADGAAAEAARSESAAHLPGRGCQDPPGAGGERAHGSLSSPAAHLLAPPTDRYTTSLFQAVGARAAEVWATLQELKASRVHARKAKAHPCDLLFSAQTDAVCHICRDLQKQVKNKQWSR